MGTIYYMPPEQFDDGQRGYQGPLCDMWSLACTLIHMVNGQPPWAGLNMGQITRKASCVMEAV